MPNRGPGNYLWGGDAGRTGSQPFPQRQAAPNGTPNYLWGGGGGAYNFGGMRTTSHFNQNANPFSQSGQMPFGLQQMSRMGGSIPQGNPFGGGRQTYGLGSSPSFSAGDTVGAMASRSPGGSPFDTPGMQQYRGSNLQFNPAMMGQAIGANNYQQMGLQQRQFNGQPEYYDQTTGNRYSPGTTMQMYDPQAMGAIQSNMNAPQQPSTLAPNWADAGGRAAPGGNALSYFNQANYAQNGPYRTLR